ncbi:MAG: hypothetical protein KJO54_02860 [Gammaproteobacteria bacterium]|nr:hypothetical protein [Gammaproteobacteria bacterium]
MVDYSKEPIARVEPATPRDARRFLWTMIVFVLIVSATLVGFSVLSNHYGYFGPAGQFEFLNGRIGKVEYLQQLPPDDLPDAYIMGSSNMMSFQSGLVDDLLPVRRTFNLAAFWGRAEDLWAWSNFVTRDLQSQPKLVILGIEPWTFANDQRGPPLMSKYRRRLLATPALAKYLPEYHPLRWYVSTFMDSLTFQSLRLMLRMSLRHRFSHVALPPIGFDPVDDTSPVPLLADRSPFLEDGTNRGHARREAEPFLPEEINGIYNQAVPRMTSESDILRLDAARRLAVDSGHIRLDDAVNFLPGDSMDAEDLQLFDRTIEYLNQNNVEVVILMLPVHPYFFDVLLAHTRHAQHLDDLRAHLKQLADRFPSVKLVFDASHIARFDGTPDAFFDRYHMTPDNSDLILRAIANEWNKAR